MHKYEGIVRKIESKAPTFGIWAENLGRKTGYYRVKTFFWSSPKFKQKNGINLSEDLFLWSSFFSNFLPPPLSNILRTLVSTRHD